MYCIAGRQHPPAKKKRKRKRKRKEEKRRFALFFLEMGIRMAMRGKDEGTVDAPYPIPYLFCGERVVGRVGRVERIEHGGVGCGERGRKEGGGGGVESNRGGLCIMIKDICIIYKR